METSAADGVFQGGGIKGLAIVGGLLGFAEHELAIERWVNVAGTSAGAIIAAYIACTDDPRRLEDVLHDTPWRKFEDYGPGGRIFGGLLRNLPRHHGLAHGEFFREWFDELIGGKRFKDVRARPVEGEDPEYRYRLKLIASDVTNKRMLVLPDDLPQYRLPGSADVIDPDDFRIADAVRMSLSIPYFFRPVTLILAESGEPATIVDGGILSNFPVWLFDVRERDPVRPTFGLRLTGGRGVGAGLRMFVDRLGWPARFAADIHETSTEAWDQRFLSHSTRVRTCPVSAGNVGTTDFDLSPEGRTELVTNGRRAATDFLDSFDIREYVNTFGRRLPMQAPQR